MIIFLQNIMRFTTMANQDPWYFSDIDWHY